MVHPLLLSFKYLVGSMKYLQIDKSGDVLGTCKLNSHRNALKWAQYLAPFQRSGT